MAESVRSKPWHACPELVARWLADFIIGQMRQLRPNYAAPEQFSGIALNRDDADIDSIELIDAASALYVALDAEASGSLDAMPIGRSFASWCAFVEYAAARTELLSFYTSGSTGKPRRVEHLLCDLDAEIRDFLPQLCAAGFTPARIVTVMPSQHLYGFLFGVLLPAQLNLPVLTLQGQAPAVVRAQLQSGDILIAHPRFWSVALAADAGGKPHKSLWPTPMLGISSGQALPDDIFAQAKLQHMRMLEIYGATETAGVAWRDAPGPMTLMARYAFADAVSSDTTQLVDCYHRGRTVAFPDQLQRSVDGRLYVLARHERVVQVAGVNVHLEHVERAIRALTGIAAVRVDIDAVTQRLSAWLVSDALDEAGLRRQLQARLSSAELPTRWYFVRALPDAGSWKGSLNTPSEPLSN